MVTGSKVAPTCKPARCLRPQPRSQKSLAEVLSLEVRNASPRITIEVAGSLDKGGRRALECQGEAILCAQIQTPDLPVDQRAQDRR